MTTGGGFTERLAMATSEDKQVNPLYIEEIQNGLSMHGVVMDVNNADYTFATDGLFRCHDEYKDKWFTVLLECKLNLNFHQPVQFAKVLIQVLFYMDQYVKAGKRLPDIVVLGSKNNAVVLDAWNLYQRFVRDEHFPNKDWDNRKIYASTAGNAKVYTGLKQKLIDSDVMQKARIVDISDEDVMSQICTQISNYGKMYGVNSCKDIEQMFLSFADIFADKENSFDKLFAFMTGLVNYCDDPQGLFSTDLVYSQERCGLLRVEGSEGYISFDEWQQWCKCNWLLGEDKDKYIKYLLDNKKGLAETYKNKQIRAKVEGLTGSENFIQSCLVVVKRDVEAYAKADNATERKSTESLILDDSFKQSLDMIWNALMYPFRKSNLVKNKMFLGKLSIANFDGTCKTAIQRGISDEADVKISKLALEGALDRCGLNMLRGLGNKILHRKAIIFVFEDEGSESDKVTCQKIARLFGKTSVGIDKDVQIWWCGSNEQFKKG